MPKTNVQVLGLQRARLLRLQPQERAQAAPPPPPTLVPEAHVTRSLARSATEAELLSAQACIKTARIDLERQQHLIHTQNQLITDLRTSSSLQGHSITSLTKELNSIESDLKEKSDSLESTSAALDDALARSECLRLRYRVSQNSIRRSKTSLSALKYNLSLARREAGESDRKLTLAEAARLAAQSEVGTCLQSLFAAKAELQVARDELEAILKQHGQLKVQYESTIEYTTRCAARMLTNLNASRKRSRAFRVRLRRAQARIQKLRHFKAGIKRLLALTTKGVYTPTIRALVRRIVLLGCPLRSAGQVLDCFVKFVSNSFHTARAKPKKARVSMNRRTVARILGEGNVAVDIQLGYELLQTPAFTTGGDGTSNKNQNFEALHLNVQAPDSYLEGDGLNIGHKVRLGGVRMSANHKSETQKNGDLACFDQVLSTFKKSPLSSSVDLPKQPLNENFIAMKFAGTHGDHAEDQKAKHRQLGEWKKEQTELGLGEKYLYEKPATEHRDIVLEAEKTMIERAGGMDAWEALAAEEKELQQLAMMNELLKDLAGEAYLGLSEDERRALHLFVWTGCEMHKEMNSVKGGDSGMKKKWALLGIAPVGLANKDNAAVLDLAEGGEENAAEVRAREVTTGGAVKLASLAGALFNHKDDKKGQHDTLRDYVKMESGRTITFSDTSNTRYSSFLEASAELIENLDFYLGYLDYMRDLKEKRTLNHLESNVQKGLLDGPTRTELAVLTLYQEAVSHSYVSTVRGPGLEHLNALDQGPLHQKVKEHIKKLINEPNIILSSDADPRIATLNGYNYWKRPNAIKAIHSLASDLPHLEEIFVAFLEEALTTWDRFSAEFADDGEIARLTEIEKTNAWMPATNDANEGALGAYRVFARKNPTGTLELFNSIFRFRRNETQDFIDSMLSGEQDQKFIMKEARDRSAARIDKKRRREIHEEHMADVAFKRRKDSERAAKRTKRANFLEDLVLELDLEKVQAMTVVQMKNQLDKLRGQDTDIPKDSTMKKREERLRELIGALERHNARLVLT